MIKTNVYQLKHKLIFVKFMKMKLIVVNVKIKKHYLKLKKVVLDQNMLCKKQINFVDKHF